MTLIAKKLELTRSGKKLLANVNFKIQPGQLVGLLGPSGAGKSTLLFALSGFRPSDSGEVRLDGRSLKDHFEELKRQIGFVPQDDIVPTALKVEKVLAYAADLRLPELDAEDRKIRVDRTLHLLDLKGQRDLRVSKLSGGQRKRVSVGVELLSEPRLLFADEPTSGLDPALERALMENLRKLASQDRMIVVTTHIMSSLDLLDLVCVLHQGHLVYFGPPKELKSFFAIEDFVELYAKLQSGEPAKLAATFAASRLASLHLGS